MRRADREVKDEKRIDEIIRACDCCRLGFIDGDSVYIVPLNFGLPKKMVSECSIFIVRGKAKR